VLLAIGGTAPDPVEAHGLTLPVVHVADPSEGSAARYLGDGDAAVYLIRPDQHVVARWNSADADAIATALANALGVTP